MLGVLGEAALRTLVLAATVQLALWVFRIRRAQFLLLTWTVVLAASLAMPALQWVTPLRVPIVFSQPSAWLLSVDDRQQQAVPAVSSGPISAVDVQTLPAIGSWLEAVYLLVSCIMLLRLMVGVALSLRLLGKSVPIRLMSAPNTRIRISQAVAAPVTVGNVILLPPDVVDWPPAMRQAALAHECAHVARGDFALLVLSQMNRALFWFSPVPWLLHRRLAALAELASDDAAMKVTGDRTGYAEVLLEMGRRSGPLLRGLAMARASTLPYRIERVLSDRAGPSQASGLQRSIIVGGAAIVSIAAASSDFNPVAPANAIANGRPLPALAVSGGFTPLAQTTVNAVPPSLPVPSRIEDTSRLSSRSAAPLATRTARLSLDVQGVARPVPRSMVSNAQPSPPARPGQARNRGADAQGEVVARTTVKAVSLPRSPPGIIAVATHSNTNGWVGEVSHAPPAQREGRIPASEPSLLKVIDQQTCDGVYLPGPAGLHDGGWLNMVRATFFRKADGTSWLKFYFGVRDPVNLPVTVTGREVEFTAANNTSFKVLPQGMNHLTGTTQSPYGTVDLACGEAGAHIFDRKS